MKYTSKYPLTNTQFLLWAGQQLHKSTPLYNMIFALKINGALKVDVFRKSLQSIIEQDEVLRTFFSTNEENALEQYIRERVEFDLDFIDYSQDVDKDKSYEKWLDERKLKILDLENCLFDFALVKLSKTKYIWYINLHHLINDAWSIALLATRVSKIYDGYISGKEQKVSLYPFSDFVNYAVNNKRDNKNEFWDGIGRLIPEAPKLYGCKNYSSTKSKRIKIHLSAEKTNRLLEIVNEPDVKSFSEHLSIFNIFSLSLFLWMYKVSGQNRLAINTPAHNRSSLVFKNTSGIFIEMFPLLLNIEEEDTIGSLLQQLKTSTLESLKNQSPGAIPQEINRKVNVVLNYVNSYFDDFASFPTEVDWVHPDHADSNHAIRLQVTRLKKDKPIDLYFDINATYFDGIDWENIPRHFINVFESVLQNRSKKLSSVSIANNEERSALNSLVNTTKISKSSEPSCENIYNVIESAMLSSSVETAILFEENEISYKELERQVNTYVKVLEENGVGKGDTISVYLKRSPEFICGILAIWKLGACFVPIASDYPARRVSFIYDDSDSKLMLSSKDLVDNVDTSKTKCLVVEQIEQTDIRDTKKAAANKIAYVMYTSGTTGKPKGVKVSHDALYNYLSWAKENYIGDQKYSIPFFSSIGFDLTITSFLLPFISGNKSVIYKEKDQGPDLAVLRVINDNKCNFIKLTPSHLRLIEHDDNSSSLISKMIVGGENFTSQLASNITSNFSKDLKIYNEYGPTEATVGCIVHEFSSEDLGDNVSIGRPINNMQAYIVDAGLNIVPQGVIGELLLSGRGLSEGYLNRPELTASKFVTNHPEIEGRLYRTGDLARIDLEGKIDYFGRIDNQVKLNGRRIELDEIQENIRNLEPISDAVVTLNKGNRFVESDHDCKKCGLPSNYPNIEFNEDGVCGLCLSFDSYQERTSKYFRNLGLLDKMFTNLNPEREYDCIALLSGGKDSTYALAKLIEKGLKVLAFTLDNGYISSQAIDNVKRVVKELGVDHVFGSTEHMNEIFVDSLKTHCNVCNGCFKTIYTLSMKIALEKKIPYIVTGLSRGQFFETRLTEELFWNDDLDIKSIDDTILTARKSYHKVDDAVKRLLDVSIFEDDKVFESVRFIDFYRYTDVSLGEMYDYLDNRLPWIRPTDTGRSTNCLINQLGIYVHKAQKGYSNYAFPYSWDVRLGHKTREESLDEINEEIDETEVKKMMDEIGYRMEDVNTDRIVAYYKGEKIKETELRNELAKELPEYMIPSLFIHVDNIPINSNGKVDYKKLNTYNQEVLSETEYKAPQGEIEEVVHRIWSEVLNLNKISTLDDFLQLGGTSLSAIRIVSRIAEQIEFEIGVDKVFEFPTIELLSKEIENSILAILDGSV